MTITREITEQDVVGQRGRIIGDHPWSGYTGEIVRIEKTIVGHGAVVRLDPALTFRMRKNASCSTGGRIGFRHAPS